jgi:hypothetical protein
MVPSEATATAEAEAQEKAVYFAKSIKKNSQQKSYGN